MPGLELVIQLIKDFIYAIIYSPLLLGIIFWKPLGGPLKLVKKFPPTRHYFCKAELVHSGYPSFNASSFVDCAGAGLDYTVDLFLCGGIDVNSGGQGNDRALIAAARNGHETVVVRVLEEDSIKVNARNNTDGSALLEAARRDFTAIVELLRTHGAHEPDLDQKVACWKLEKAGYSLTGTDFFRAVRERRLPIVELFITAGIPVEERDADDNTALILAAQHADLACFNVLLSNGVDFNASNNFGDTALIVAARSDKNYDIVKGLLAAKVKINWRNNKDESAWIAAIKAGADKIETLFEGKADDQDVKKWRLRVAFEKQGLFNEEAFVKSCVQGQTDIVSDYLTAGMSVNVQSADGEPAFVIAVRQRKPELIGLFLEHPDLDVNAHADKQDSALILAARKGWKTIVESLLNHKNINLDLQGNNGDTALIAAARLGDEDIVALLLKKPGIDVDDVVVNATNDSKESALLEAARRRFIPIVNRLRDKGAQEPDLERKVARWQLEQDGQFTDEELLRCTLALNVERVKKLLVAGLPPDHARDSEGNTALLLAAKMENRKLIKLLLKFGAKVNDRNHLFDTPLIVAARHGREAAVRFLIRAGADVHGRNHAGETALLDAARREFKSIVKRLRDKGAQESDLERKVARWQLEQNEQFTDEELLRCTLALNIERVKKLLVAGLPPDHARDGEGNTALLLAAKMENRKLIKLLLKHGARVDDRNHLGDTPLIVAARHGREAAVRFLIKAGTDVHGRNHAGETASLEAARRRFESVVRRLRNRGAEEPDKRRVAQWQLEHEGVWNDSQFVRAARRGDMDKVSQYLEAEININATDERDETALIAATRGNRISIVKLLLKNSADPATRDREGASAIEIALSRRFEEIISLLTDAGAVTNSKSVALRRIRECGLRYGPDDFIRQAANGQNDRVMLFLDAGVDANAEDDRGFRALVEAAKAGQKSVVELLLKHGADSNLRDAFGMSARQAAEMNGYHDVAEVLAIAGAESPPTSTDMLIDAIERADVVTVRKALASSASPDTYTNQGQPILMEAVLAENQEIVAELLKKGARANAHDGEGMTSLMRAAERGLVNMMKVLLASKTAGLDDVDQHGRTALIIAAARGHVAAVSTLIEHGANQDIRDYQERSAVMAASAKNYEPIVKILKPHGAVEGNKQAVLLFAATHGEDDRVNALIGQGVGVDSISDEEGNKPLALAAARGWSRTMELLIRAGAKTDAANRDGDTPLMLASRAGRIAAVKVLLKQSTGHALASAINKNGETALFQASLAGNGSVVELLAPYTDQPDLGAGGRVPLVEMCYRGDLAAVKALVAAGADVNQQQVTLGKSPLMTAVLSGHVEIIETLEENGAWAGKDEAQLFLMAKNGDDEGLQELHFEKVDLNARNQDGWTALMVAANDGHDGVVKILLDNGADADKASPDGDETALRLAASNGRTRALDLLIKKTKRGKSSDARALIEATSKGHSESVRLLIKKADAPVNGLKGGPIPLIEAASKNHLQTVKVLLDLGADASIESRQRITALSAAMLRGHKDVVDLLLQHGSDAGVKDVLLLIAAGKPDLTEVKRLLRLPEPPNLDARDESGRTPLMRACDKGAEAVVEKLLSCYPQNRVHMAVIDRDSHHYTTLMWAAKGGSAAIVSRLLELKANVYALSKNNRTALMAACKAGVYRSVEILLNAMTEKDRAVAVNQQDDDGNSPLTEALLGASGRSRRDYAQIISLLEQLGATQGREHAKFITAVQKCDLNSVEQCIGKVDLNKFRHKDRTPLMLAVESSCKKVVEYLLKKGVDVDERGPSGATALILAAKKQTVKRVDEEIVQLLLDHGANRDSIDKTSNSALLYAIQHRHEGILRALIAEGANVNKKDTTGSTALTLAVKLNNEPIVRMLLEKSTRKVDLEVWTGDRQTALTLAHLHSRKLNLSGANLPARGETLPNTLLNQLTKIEALLLKAGAREGWNEAELTLAIRDGDADWTNQLLKTTSIHTRDLEGNTPLLLACVRDDLPLVRTLLKRRASLAVHNAKERTPLIEAAEKGSYQVVKELIEADQDLNLDAQDEDRETALLKAARTGAAKVVTFLLDYKANARVATPSGSTPLIEMCKHSDLGAVQKLLRHGANACACTTDHRTAITEAAARGHLQILAALLDHLKTRLANDDEKRRIIINAVDNQYHTALDWATEGKYRQCVDLLKKHGAESKTHTPFTVYTTPEGGAYHTFFCPRISIARDRDVLEERLMRDAIRLQYEFCLSCQPGHTRISWTC